MHARLSYAAAALLLLLPCLSIRAQELGLYNSPKGIGVQCASGVRDGVFHTVTAFVDIYGVATSRCQYPGYRFNASRLYVLRTISAGDVNMRIYAGPGVSAGYVHDHDKGRGIDITNLISDSPGGMLAVSGEAGCRFDFGRLVSLDLSFTAEAGAHIRHNRKETGYTAAYLSIYNNGLLQAFYPQLSIFFSLR